MNILYNPSLVTQFKEIGSIFKLYTNEVKEYLETGCLTVSFFLQPDYVPLNIHIHKSLSSKTSYLIGLCTNKPESLTKALYHYYYNFALSFIGKLVLNEYTTKLRDKVLRDTYPITIKYLHPLGVNFDLSVLRDLLYQIDPDANLYLSSQYNTGMYIVGDFRYKIPKGLQVWRKPLYDSYLQAFSFGSKEDARVAHQRLAAWDTAEFSKLRISTDIMYPANPTFETLSLGTSLNIYGSSVLSKKNPMLPKAHIDSIVSCTTFINYVQTCMGTSDVQPKDYSYLLRRVSKHTNPYNFKSWGERANSLTGIFSDKHPISTSDLNSLLVCTVKLKADPYKY